MEPLKVSREICQNFSEALRYEWLETDGLGGYALSTIAGANTSRYHGLYVGSLQHATDRFSLLSAVEDSIEIGGQRYPLSPPLRSGFVQPAGKVLVHFSLDPFPTFFYEIGDFKLVRVSFLARKERAVVLIYRLLQGDETVKLHVKPLVSFRDQQSLGFESQSFAPVKDLGKGRMTLSSPASPEMLHFYHNAAITDKTGTWMSHVELPFDPKQPGGCSEDLYSPCEFIYSFASSGEVYLAAGRELLEEWDSRAIRAAEVDRRHKLRAGFKSDEKLWAYLWQAADHFLVEENGKPLILSAYPEGHFLCRDALIALKGLLLSREKYETAFQILVQIAGSMQHGMFPDKLTGDEQKSEYHQVDTSMWFIKACFDYLRYSEDFSGAEKGLYPTCRKILLDFKQGIVPGASVDVDGLLVVEDPKLAQSFLDLWIRGDVVLARKGKLADLNALLYNAVCSVREMAHLFRDTETLELCSAWSEQIREAYGQVFWSPEGFLYDSVDGKLVDDAIRPGLIFAVGLHFAVLEESKWKGHVERIEMSLLTPVGLRSLNPDHQAYIGEAHDPIERERSRVLGSVLPWFIAPFITAFLNVHGYSSESRSHAREMLAHLLARLESRGLGQISESFDGDSPYEEWGGVAQAAPIGEIIRLYEMIQRDKRDPESLPDFVLK